MEIQKNEEQPNDNNNNSNDNIIINIEKSNKNIDENEQQKKNNENNSNSQEKSIEIKNNNNEKINENININIINIEKSKEQNNNINNIEQNNENNIKNNIININKVEQTNGNKINNNDIEIKKSDDINEIKEEIEIIMNKDENIDNNENKKKNENQETKLDMIIKSLKEKDDIIKSLQNNIINLSTQIKEIKESNEQMKQDYEKQINDLKEVMAKKEDIKYFVKKRELQFVSDNLDALSDKYNNFERVIESKMGFMESNMTKIFEKGEELKKLEENKIIINKDDNIDNNDKNKVKNNNDKNIKDKKIEKKETLKQKSLKDQFDMKIYKKLNKILDNIFSKKNLKNVEIDNKNFENFVKESKDLFQKKHAPIDFCSEYINELKEKTVPELFNNLEQKKIKLLQNLNDVNDKISPKLNLLNIDVKDFNIEEFRKEYGFTEEKFPDDVLKKTYVTCRGDLGALLLRLTKY